MLSLRTSPVFISKQLKLTTTTQTHLKLKMSTNNTTTTSKNQTIEHIVLFKVKPDTDQSKLNSMLNALNSLISLDQVLHLTAGALFRTRSPTLNFTHMLHSRYATKDNLSAYSAHPDHMRVVKEHVLPLCEDIMSVDWEADDFDGPIVPHAGSAMRVTFLKVKDDVGCQGKSDIITVVKGLKEKFGGIVQLTCGENFSPARAKGYGIASLAVFDGVSEMESVVGNELAGFEKDKVREYLESVFVVDYVIPAAAQSASL